ncbi:hypothetical protein [Fusobacterium nucleatum]|uniref:hypothetical protein n=1 Tax=Fusobacterium nucleatum TaxID=851 RepID=UPI0030D6112F
MNNKNKKYIYSNENGLDVKEEINKYSGTISSDMKMEGNKYSSVNDREEVVKRYSGTSDSDITKLKLGYMKLGLEADNGSIYLKKENNKK